MRKENSVGAFFQTGYKNLIDSPNNAHIWWHSIPLPDGNRINGNSKDKDLQLKKWQTMKIGNEKGLESKRVLDIGANDGFFSLAALMAGAAEVTSLDMDWGTWPQNIEYASKLWQVKPNIITSDFRTHDFGQKFDVILFLGVLYHVEDVFNCILRLRDLLVDNGELYIETQMSKIEHPSPLFESASDTFSGTFKQGKKNLAKVGISNYLFPNEAAMKNLAYSYDFHFESLGGPQKPLRRFFKFTRQ